jgi:DNA helicase-2/ATP-dependent DNA helicase PcrA
VLDGWELENVFDAEFGEKAGVDSKVRRREIRGDFEALWSTGQHRRPTGQTPPDPPISDSERDSFRAFHTPRTHLYACVLPGELVQRCVARIEAGTLDPVTLLEIDHLIVDEFQDLNPMDLRFVDALAQRGVTVFVAGDDDQSPYSFRYAAPSGIRRFLETYPGAGDHSLRHCFRCTPAVLNAAQALIASNAEPERIPKTHVSMYAHADPPVAGGVGCWRFTNDEAEARAVAQSIHHLCAEGMPARQIMVLLANANTLCRALLPALDDAGIAYEVPRTTPFKDTDVGRALMTALRLGVRDDDFVALRTLLALRRGVGVGTAAAIGDVVIANNLSYRDLFGDFDEDLVSGRQLGAIGAVRETVEQAREWGPDDELREHAHQIDALLPDILNREPEAFWRDEFTALPDETTLAEALQYLAADKDEQRARPGGDPQAAGQRCRGRGIAARRRARDDDARRQGTVRPDGLHPGTRAGDPAGPEAPALHRAGARGRAHALCLDHSRPPRLHHQLRRVAHDARDAGAADSVELHHPPRHHLHPP